MHTLSIATGDKKKDFGPYPYLCCTLLHSHDGRALVVHRVLVAHDADVEASPKLERGLEQVLVANVAKVVHTVAVHVDVDSEQREVHVRAQVAKHSPVARLCPYEKLGEGE